MAEELRIAEGSKEDKYRLLYRQIQEMVADETDIIARMANTAAMIHQTFGFWWTGFYRVSAEDDILVLGPFQGPVACTRIPYGKGVCGTAWAQNKSTVVPDVDLFPGHIACSSASRSEIVIPLHERASDKVMAVLDIDSAEPATFDDTDRIWLERIAELI